MSEDANESPIENMSDIIKIFGEETLTDSSKLQGLIKDFYVKPDYKKFLQVKIRQGVKI